MTATELVGAVPSARSLSRYRQACDYLAAVMIYLRSNVLLREPLRAEHLKPRLLGHWGTCPGISYAYAGLNRLIRRTGQQTLLVVGPGHGAPAVHANLWLEGTHGEHDPALRRDAAGMAELVRRFSWPGGAVTDAATAASETATETKAFPSHLSPEVPGVIHEGGELGYALATAAGAALDNHELLVACIVGDGEAETGPTAASWHVNKFLDPSTDGILLPILHLNGYKISSPTIFGCMSDDELRAFCYGNGWAPRLVDVQMATNPDQALADALDAAYEQATALRERWRHGDRPDLRPVWPMLIMRTPKGWGAPDADSQGRPLAGTFNAHQVPLANAGSDPDELWLLEHWLRSYRPWELFDGDGRPVPEVLAVPPAGPLRMGSAPPANGGRLRRELPLPPVAAAALDVPTPGAATASATETLASWLAGLMRATEERRDFRIVCPDELESNKLGGVLAATDRAFSWPIPGYAEHMRPGGRVMEVLSEHLCQGWLQGYLLTGRHGLFPCYEAFVSIVDGMVNQYAKFLKLAAEVPWREPIASLNYLLTSEGWRQEHNGYSHQGPGFINNVLTKKASVSRVYLPPDANTLLVTMRHCLASTGRINVVVAGKQPAAQWLDIQTAEAHCRAGAGVWHWAGSGDGDSPDVVLACAGNVPTVETLAAAWLLRRLAPELGVRVVNVVDLLTLAPHERHPHGMSTPEFDACFGTDRPVVFAFHGYPSAVHELLHGRADPNRFHVHGYLEEGTTTTPFVLLAANRMTRHDLAIDALSRAPAWSSDAGELIEALRTERNGFVAAALRDGVDPADVTGWQWSA